MRSEVILVYFIIAAGYICANFEIRGAGSELSKHPVSATCLMRPHFVYVFLVVSRIIILCYIIRLGGSTSCAILQTQNSFDPSSKFREIHSLKIGGTPSLRYKIPVFSDPDPGKS